MKLRSLASAGVVATALACRLDDVIDGQRAHVDRADLIGAPKEPHRLTASSGGDAAPSPRALSSGAGSGRPRGEAAHPFVDVASERVCDGERALGLAERPRMPFASTTSTRTESCSAAAATMRGMKKVRNSSVTTSAASLARARKRPRPAPCSGST